MIITSSLLANVCRVKMMWLPSGVHRGWPTSSAPPASWCGFDPSTATSQISEVSLPGRALVNTRELPSGDQSGSAAPRWSMVVRTVPLASAISSTGGCGPRGAVTKAILVPSGDHTPSVASSRMTRGGAVPGPAIQICGPLSVYAVNSNAAGRSTGEVLGGQGGSSGSPVGVFGWAKIVEGVTVVARPAAARVSSNSNVPASSILKPGSALDIDVEVMEMDACRTRYLDGSAIPPSVNPHVDRPRPAVQREEPVEIDIDHAAHSRVREADRGVQLEAGVGKGVGLETLGAHLLVAAVDVAAQRRHVDVDNQSSELVVIEGGDAGHGRRSPYRVTRCRDRAELLADAISDEARRVDDAPLAVQLDDVGILGGRDCAGVSGMEGSRCRCIASGPCQIAVAGQRNGNHDGCASDDPRAT